MLHKHSLTLHGHRTSLTLEDEFWKELQAIAKRQKRSLQNLIEEIDGERKGNLSSALRIYILESIKSNN